MKTCITKATLDPQISLGELAVHDFFVLAEELFLITACQNPDRWGYTIVTYNFNKDCMVLFPPDRTVLQVKNLNVKYSI